MGEKTITTSVVILVFAVILVIAIMAAWTVEPSSFDTTHWRVFIITLSSLSVIITFMFYYAIVELQGLDQEVAAIQQVQKLSARVSEIQSVSFPRYYKIIPKFVTSLFSEECKVITSRSKSEVITSSRSKSEVISRSSDMGDSTKWEKRIASNGLAFEIFSVWELSVSEEERSNGCTQYTVLFEKWARSDYLRAEWLKQRKYFSCKTVEYGDALFEGEC